MFGFRAKPKPIERVEPTIGNILETETAISSDKVKMFEIFGEPNTSAGAVVNECTSMRVSAVYSCVSLIAGSIAQLPLPIYKRVGDSRQRVDHDYWWILNEQFCDGWSAAAGWEFLITQMLLRGDGIGYLMRRFPGDSEVQGIIPWPRDRVEIAVQLRNHPKEPKRLQYTFHDDQGYFTVDQSDVLHIPGFGFNGCHSMSVIQWGARNGIGIAIKGDEHAGQFFSQGGKPEIVVKVPGEMTAKMQDDFRDAWVAKYGGKGPNSIPLILTEGLETKELTMTAVDQQLLESRQWQVIDIARAFGVPPHMIGETSKTTSWGTGIEQLGIGFVKYTLGAHLRRARDEMNRKLWRQSTYFTEHNVDSLMAGDSKAQAEFFSKALGGPGTQGWMSVNEVRRLKNMQPKDGWDDITKAGGKPAATENSNEDPEAVAAGA